MLVSARRYAEESTLVTVGDLDIPQVDSLRLLGVTLQITLRWDLDVNNMATLANTSWLSSSAAGWASRIL